MCLNNSPEFLCVHKNQNYFVTVSRVSWVSGESEFSGFVSCVHLQCCPYGSVAGR